MASSSPVVSAAGAVLTAAAASSGSLLDDERDEADTDLGLSVEQQNMEQVEVADDAVSVLMRAIICNHWKNTRTDTPHRQK